MKNVILLSMLVASTISYAEDFSCTVSIDQIKSEPITVKVGTSLFKKSKGIFEESSFTMTSPVNGPLKGRMMMYDPALDPSLVSVSKEHPIQLDFFFNIDQFSYYKKTTRRYEGLGKIRKYKTSRVQIHTSVPYDSKYFTVSVDGIRAECKK